MSRTLDKYRSSYAAITGVYTDKLYLAVEALAIALFAQDCRMLPIPAHTRDKQCAMVDTRCL